MPKSKVTETVENLPQDSAEWTKAVIEQMSNAQKMWVEIAQQQSELVFKTVTDIIQASQNAPTGALGDWAKQNLEGFVEAQRKWSEVSMQQSEQMMTIMQSGANTVPMLASMQAATTQGFQTLVKMRMAWLDSAAQQNSQVIKAMKESLNLEESSPAVALANVAEQAMNNYVEVQKRWLDLAMKLPVFGGSTDKK